MSNQEEKLQKPEEKTAASWKGHAIQTVAMFALLGVLFLYSTFTFLNARKLAPIYPGKGVTSEKRLSDYLPNLKETSGDSRIFTLDSGKPGGVVLILGGAHNDEPSGFLAPLIFIENTVVSSGKVFVIPRSNRSGQTHSQPLDGFPEKYAIKTLGGDRWFNFGSRYSNPVDQWPDPDVTVHKPSGQRLAGEDARNLNRVWPGLSNGTFTERIAYAIVKLIKDENVDVTIDCHEAPLEYFLINAMCFHERSQSIATTAHLNLSLLDIQINLEASPPNLHGYSHRELGEYTPTHALLLETANPIMGRLRGRTDAEKIVSGKDRNYVIAGKLGRLFVPMDEKGWPLDIRVARHVTAISEIINAWNELHPEKKIIVSNMPSYEDIANKGTGSFLHPPQS